ncbi:prolyl-tRNA synthetase associated domain-containing protein [Methylobacterium radiodurans]|uniref:DNA-binding protein n=1 Tax=Methylobacterium radiodurans TaxID=2202828 RepID=A0A2U8VNB1_9HYPH|nr:prolyl-tRNA synthetase associated domain-containing protein [Methylobacterium radiodurans]AWN35095.1 DNA-binding protein [Methylobacterium radiodurans]
MPMDPNELIARLNECGIAYELFEHPAVLTVDEMMATCGDIGGTHTKNLFLRDGKKAHYLVTLRHDARIDLKALRSVLGARGGLSFASTEALREHLGVESGAVSPFAAMNSAPGAVKIFVQDRLLLEEHIDVHPLSNNLTLKIKPEDMMAALRADGRSSEIFALPDSDEV